MLLPLPLPLLLLLLKVKDRLDKTAIEAAARTVVGREFIAGHLLLQVGNGMEDILVEHYMRGLMRRILAQRAVDMLDTVEVRMCVCVCVSLSPSRFCTPINPN